MLKNMKLSLILSSLFAFLTGCKMPALHNPIPNFSVIDSSNRIYRGAEPLPEGWTYLASLGVTNVVKLDTEAESTDTNAVALGMTIQRFPFTTEEQLFGPVDGAKVSAAVNAISGNTFIHCGSDKRSASEFNVILGNVGGQDRTGLICACYRVKTGWTKADAEKEMLDRGFHKVLRGLWEFWEDKVK